MCETEGEGGGGGVGRKERERNEGVRKEEVERKKRGEFAVEFANFKN